MSVGFGTGFSAGPAGGSSPASLTGVVSGQPLIVFCSGTTMPTITDTFATPYTYTQVTSTGAGSSCQLIVGTGGSGTSGTVTSSAGIICIASCTGASLASGASIIDAYATSSSNTVTGSVTPTQPGEAVIGMIVSPYEGISYSGPYYANGELILGYPAWVAPDATGIASGSPVSFSFGTFGRAAGSIVCSIFAAGYPSPSQLVMPL